MTQGFHEDFHRPEKVKGSSDRTFGIIFAAFFLIVGLWPLLDGEGPRIWSLAVAALFLVTAFIAPAYLAPLNRLWTRFGDLLHRVVNPVVLGLMFLVAITPVALVMRALGKDPLNRRADPSADTYWVKREQAGPPAESMRNQF